MREEKKRLERVCQLLLEFKAKLSPQKQSAKFKCQIWSDINKKSA